jgi:hypothetical protein
MLSIGPSLSIDISNGGNAMSYPLDKLPTPQLAVSVRKLIAAYSGACMRVRRDSDNTEQDIGFTGPGVLDTLSLLGFVGAGNGYVVAWYDQSGNANDMTSSIAVEQPIIVSAGVLVTVNSQPFIAFYGQSRGTSNCLALAATQATVGTITAVMSVQGSQDGFILSAEVTYFWHGFGPDLGGDLLLNAQYVSDAIQSGAAWYNGASILPDSIPWPTDLSVITLQPNSLVDTSWDNLGRDRETIHNLGGGGGYSELITWIVTIDTGDRESLEANQGEYFGVAIS